MTARAVDTKEAFAVLRIAARRICGCGGGQRTQVREDLPALIVEDARVGWHLGARHAFLDGLEQTRVSAARRPHLRNVRPADPTRVHTVAFCTAPAEKAHPGLNRVRVAVERILCLRLLRG